MNSEQLTHYRRLAEKHKAQQSGRIMLELLDYLEELRERKIRKGGSFDVDSAFPFAGEYRGEALGNIPYAVLRQWRDSHKREELQIDSEFQPSPQKFIARRKLQLYDWITHELNEAFELNTTEGNVAYI